MPASKRGEAGAASREPQWVGAARYRVRGETGYSAFQIDGEHYRLGDTVLLKACDGFEQDFVARIEALWEDGAGEKHLEGRWYYLPEHTRTGRLRRHHRREVFESTHTDDNPLDAVQSKCAVLDWDAFRSWAAQPADDGAEDEAETTFVCRASYNTTTHDIRPLASSAGADAFGEHALAELPLLSDPSAAPRGAAADKAPRKQAPLLTGRRAQNPFAEARACLLLNAPPARLPCREEQRETIMAWMRSAIAEGGASSPLYVSGVPGTGKTATVHEVCRVLRGEERAGTLPPFACAEINGMRLPVPTHAYTLLWEVLSGKRQSLSPTKAMHMLDAHFATARAPTKRKRRQCTVLIVDELDYLVTKNQGVLYNLFEWSSRAHAQVALVGISNTMDLPERLLPRLNSRMGLARVPFLPYALPELSQILRARLGDLAVFEGSGLELACRKVAAVSGDVRRNLEICRRATEIAEARTAARAGGGAEATLSTPRAGAGAPRAEEPPAARVTIEDINAAIKQLHQSLPVRAMRSLGLHGQLLLVCALLEAERCGRTAVRVADVLARHAGACARHGVERPAAGELLGVVDELSAARLLAPAPGSIGAAAGLEGSVQLAVEADDLKLAVCTDGMACEAIARAELRQ